MLKRRFTNFAVLALTLSVTPFLLGCSSDDEGNGGTGPGEASDFVGSWNATSFVADGTDLVAGGTSIAFSFTETTYSFNVANDTNGVLCDPGLLACADSGDLGSTATTLTFDPGTADAVTFAYAVNGDVLTVSGTVEGSSIGASFSKL
jgi:hypothetical protein